MYESGNMDLAPLVGIGGAIQNVQTTFKQLEPVSYCVSRENPSRLQSTAAPKLQVYLKLQTDLVQITNR